MSEARPRRRRWLLTSLVAAVAFLGVAFVAFRGDLIRYSLDPKTPFQTYRPPPAPDYAQRKAWFLLPTHPDAPGATEPPADVFFVSPTTYEGGPQWNDPVGDPRADKVFRRVMAPNYAGPFVRLGRIFAPRYRQAGLYSLLTLHDDAKDARKFAYADVAAAFRYWRDHDNEGRPFVIVGVEQGGTLAARLLAEEIAPDARLRGAPGRRLSDRDRGLRHPSGAAALHAARRGRLHRRLGQRPGERDRPRPYPARPGAGLGRER